MNLIKVLLIFLVLLPLSASAYDMEMVEKVALKAKAAGLDAGVIASVIVCESQGNPLAYNEDGGAQARGLWQITRKWHPEVSDKIAYDWEKSTDWSLNRILLGFHKEWSCWPKGVVAYRNNTGMV